MTRSSYLRRVWAVRLARVALAISAANAVPPISFAQQSDDVTSLRGELAERLLQGVVVPPPATSPPPATVVGLFPGRVPPGLPADFPLPTGGRLLGSAVWGSAGSPPPPGAGSTEIVIDAPDAPSSVQAYFASTLPTRGWRQNPPVADGPTQGGFQAAATASYCTPDNRLASLRVASLLNGMSDVRFRVQAQPSPPCLVPPGAPTPAVMPPGSPPPPLPTLQAPVGVLLRPRLVPPGVPGGGYAVSEATADTDLTVADLEAAFAAQLRAASWVRLDSGEEPAVAWSRWQVPGPGERQGWLFVLAGPGARQRLLSLRIESPAPTSPAVAPPGPTLVAPGS